MPNSFYLFEPIPVILDSTRPKILEGNAIMVPLQNIITGKLVFLELVPKNA